MSNYQNKQTLMEEYQNKSIGKIANKYDVSKSTIHYWMDKHNIERRKHPRDQMISLHTNMSGSNVGYEIWQARVDGEVKRVSHHRLLMVAEHGYDALTDKVVHHINGIRWDNRVENLELMTAEEHNELHRNS